MPRNSPDGGIYTGAVAALATSSFVYVTAETLPVGLLPQIGHGLSVSEADVGLLLTSYAFVAGASTVPLTALTMRVPRHLLIAALVAVFAVSQAVAAVSTSFLMLVVARLLCAVAHGVFWSAISPVAARLGPPGQAGRLTSLVFAGNGLALVLGVPLATALGQAAGWRTAFAALAVAGALSTVALLRLLPKLPPMPKDTERSVGEHVRASLRVLGEHKVAVVCVVTAVVVVAQFAAYTYVAPLVQRDAGISGLALSALLLGYGAAGLATNFGAGRYVDRCPVLVLAGGVTAIVVALVVLAAARGALPTTIALLLWGAGFVSMPVSLQSAILRVAPHAQDAASAVYVVAFQIGIGGGALVGGWFVRAGHLGVLPWAAGGAAALALAVVVLRRSAFGAPPVAGSLERRPRQDATT